MQVGRVLSQPMRVKTTHVNVKTSDCGHETGLMSDAAGYRPTTLLQSIERRASAASCNSAGGGVTGNQFVDGHHPSCHIPREYTAVS